jgi:hypothetical protein
MCASNSFNEITHSSIALKCEGFLLALQCQELLCDFCSHVYPAAMVRPDILQHSIAKDVGFVEGDAVLLGDGS